MLIRKTRRSIFMIPPPLAPRALNYAMKSKRKQTGCEMKSTAFRRARFPLPILTKQLSEEFQELFFLFERFPFSYGKRAFHARLFHSFLFFLRRSNLRVDFCVLRTVLRFEQITDFRKQLFRRGNGGRGSRFRLGCGCGFFGRLFGCFLLRL